MLNGKDESYYLTSGKRTEVGEKVKELAKELPDGDTKAVAISILHLMNTKVKRYTKEDNKRELNDSDPKKFKRSAEEIITDNYRNGCCDSSTLFVALCRAKEIPAVQIITADLKDRFNYDERHKNDIKKHKLHGNGHFFAGFYSKEDKKWLVIDSDKSEQKIEDYIKSDNKPNKFFIEEYNPNLAFIADYYYQFACVRDYSEFEIDGEKILSIDNIKKVHQKVYEKIDAKFDLKAKERADIERILMGRPLLNEDYIANNKEKLFKLIPELQAEEGYYENNNSIDYDIWEKTVQSLSCSKPDLNIRIALLLHNIGKPHNSKNIEDSFLNKSSAYKSAGIARDILIRLGYDFKTIRDISELVEHHAKPIYTEGIEQNNLVFYENLLYLKACIAKSYSPEKALKTLNQLSQIRSEMVKIKKSIKSKIEKEER